MSNLFLAILYMIAPYDIYTPTTIPNEPGTYEVEITNQGEDISTIIYVTIEGENTVIEDALAINANDFTINEANITTENILSLSSVKAWNTQTLEEASPNEIIVSLPSEINLGSNNVSFTYENVSTTVSMVVVRYDVGTEEEVPFLGYLEERILEVVILLFVSIILPFLGYIFLLNKISTIVDEIIKLVEIE